MVFKPRKPIMKWFLVIAIFNNFFVVPSRITLVKLQLITDLVLRKTGLR